MIEAPASRTRRAPAGVTVQRDGDGVRSYCRTFCALDTRRDQPALIQVNPRTTVRPAPPHTRAAYRIIYRHARMIRLERTTMPDGTSIERQALHPKIARALAYWRAIRPSPGV